MIFYVMSQNGGLTTIGKTYTFGKMFNLGIEDICKPAVYSAKMEMPPIYIQFSSIIGVWIRSSAAPVLTLFCALVLVASLLAEELNNQTNIEAFSTERKNNLNEWFNNFNQLHIIADSIKDCFNPILAITVVYFFFQFPCSVYNIILNVFMNSAPSFIIFQNMYFIFMLSLRFGTVAIVCQHLRDKVSQQLIVYTDFITNVS